MPGQSLEGLTAALTSHDWLLSKTTLIDGGEQVTILFTLQPDRTISVIAPNEAPETEPVGDFVVTFHPPPERKVVAGGAFMTPFSTGTWRIGNGTNNQLVIDNIPADGGPTNTYEIEILAGERQQMVLRGYEDAVLKMTVELVQY